MNPDRSNWDFFLAHSGHDTAVAEELYALLSPGARVFLDSKSIALGDDWDSTLLDAQKRSLITVVLVSSNTSTAYYQREEIAAAIAMARNDPDGHRVIPIYLTDVENSEAPYGLRLKHGLSLPPGSRGLRKVASQLRRALKRISSRPVVDAKADKVGVTALREQQGAAALGKAVIENAKRFRAATVTFMGFLESNIDAMYRIREKAGLEREVRHISALIGLFPQIMFFNGVFLTEFAPEYVMTVEDSDSFSKSRDLRTVAELNRSLDGFSEHFAEHAPHVRGLGTDMIVLFRQGIDLRRAVVAHFHSASRETMSNRQLAALRKELEAVYEIEEHLEELRSKLKMSKY